MGGLPHPTSDSSSGATVVTLGAAVTNLTFAPSGFEGVPVFLSPEVPVFDMPTPGSGCQASLNIVVLSPHAPVGGSTDGQYELGYTFTGTDAAGSMDCETYAQAVFSSGFSVHYDNVTVLDPYESSSLGTAMTVNLQFTQ
jgi:hypothetical protein